MNDTKRTAGAEMESSNLSDARSAIVRCEDWIKNHWQSGLARYSGEGTPNPLATCFAVCGLECVAGLDGIGDDRSEDVIERLCESQDSENGWFLPGVLKRDELTGRAVGHNATYMKMQMTYFALHALDALGGNPPSDIVSAKRFCDKAYLTGWIDAGPWHDPWLVSNSIMFALTFLIHRSLRHSDELALRAVDGVLDYLDGRQDPRTGLWQPDDEPDMNNAVFAAYHFFPFYFWRRRAPNYVERIIDSTLSVQSSTGGFGGEEGGGACEDLDAIHTLVMMALVTDYRREDTESALRLCREWIMGLQNEDGGFPNYPDPGLKKSLKRRLAETLGLDQLLNRPAYRPISSYSGWRPLTVLRGASDMWGAWFRMLTLRLIHEFLYPGEVLSPSARYRRLPGLGWHDVEAIQASVRNS